MPHDVVTMNSRVKFRNLSDGEVGMRTLSVSSQYDPAFTLSDDRRLLALHFWACALATPFHWELPGGTSTHLEVIELEYQPEAAGDYLR